MRACVYWLEFTLTCSKGSSITPPHNGASFQFKDYAPTIFRHLRDAFSIDTGAHKCVAVSDFEFGAS